MTHCMSVKGEGNFAPPPPPPPVVSSSNPQPFAPRSSRRKRGKLLLYHMRSEQGSSLLNPPSFRISPSQLSCFLALAAAIH